jgi:hypothetical protein
VACDANQPGETSSKKQQDIGEADGYTMENIESASPQTVGTVEGDHDSYVRSAEISDNLGSASGGTRFASFSVRILIGRVHI